MSKEEKQNKVPTDWCSWSSCFSIYVLINEYWISYVLILYNRYIHFDCLPTQTQMKKHRLYKMKYIIYVCYVYQYKMNVQSVRTHEYIDINDNEKEIMRKMMAYYLCIVFKFLIMIVRWNYMGSSPAMHLNTYWKIM